MIVGIVSLLVMLFVSLIIQRLATQALMLTGLSLESARFQSRSSLTNSGFTTSEAESVMNHPVRRRIIMILMLVGSIGIPTVIATTVASVVASSRTEEWWWPVLLLIVGLICLNLFSRNVWVERKMNRIFVWMLKRWTHLHVQDYVSLLQLQNGYIVTEMVIESGDWLEGKSIQNSALAHEGVLILGIQRARGEYIGTPRASDTIVAGDTLILYSKQERLVELDQRTSENGEAAHARAVAEYYDRAARRYAESESNGSE